MKTFVKRRGAQASASYFLPACVLLVGGGFAALVLHSGSPETSAVQPSPAVALSAAQVVPPSAAAPRVEAQPTQAEPVLAETLVVASPLAPLEPQVVQPPAVAAVAPAPVVAPPVVTLAATPAPALVAPKPTATIALAAVAKLVVAAPSPVLAPKVVAPVQVATVQPAAVAPEAAPAATKVQPAPRKPKPVVKPPVVAKAAPKKDVPVVASTPMRAPLDSDAVLPEVASAAAIALAKKNEPHTSRISADSPGISETSRAVNTVTVRPAEKPSAPVVSASATYSANVKASPVVTASSVNHSQVVASSPTGDRVWVRIDDKRTVIVNKGQAAPGLGVFHGADGNKAQFDSGFLPINQ